ncbi:MAG: hypothetical protein BWK73_10625 [Thiothrix lacustris]|uniref:Uncharacterized protein n=1 Tax=Thiothrix lacustris TaxID=525917 RepID=A0A1Y1QUE8_9GAMM|nr:MAG: hypothetical protein BWK73_10625 [Thiothrix lacustris]
MSNTTLAKLDEQYQALLTKLADSVTSEVGRALVDLTVLQLTIKAISPEQNIRLHKGGNIGDVEKLAELQTRITEIEDLHGTSIHILTLDEWVEYQAQGVENSTALARHWLIAYTESLAQRRPKIAPIDEPCFQWLQEWHNILQTSVAAV